MKLQILKFCCVGSLAAAVHMGVVALLVSVFGVQPLIANIFGFSTAFGVSYSGHRFWTFDNSTSLGHAVSIARFWSVAVSSFIANETLFYVFLRFTPLPYLVALFVVLLLVTPLTFLLSKIWAFS